jgi:fucose 4-O-acetylase-like acetyltransferase
MSASTLYPQVMAALGLRPAAPPALAEPLLPSDTPSCSGDAAAPAAGSAKPARASAGALATADKAMSAGGRRGGRASCEPGDLDEGGTPTSWEEEYNDSLRISLPASASADARERLPLLDNAKAALIFLVVMYHTMVVYTSADRPEGPIPLWSGVLCLLKPVVMPSFCLISGHLSRADLTSRRAYELCQLVVTYVIFQALYHVNNMVAYRLAGFDFRTFPLQIFQPESQVVTWFLLALALWRLLLPAVSRLRAPITTSLVLANAALFVDLGLNYQNLLSFFPFFLVGHALPSAAWRALARPRIRAFCALLFILSAALALLFSYTGRSFHNGPTFTVAFANVTSTYGCMNGYAPNATPYICSTLDALYLRLLFYASSAPLIAGFFAVLPRAAGSWSIPGHMSMFVYLLHPLVITNAVVMKLGFRHLSAVSGREVNVWAPATDGWAVTSLVLPLSLGVVILLSTPPARWLLWPLIQPPISLLVRDDAFRSISDSYSSLRAAGQRRRGMDPRAR